MILPHSIFSGDCLREERNDPTSEFAELINHHIKEGLIVPVEITCKCYAMLLMKNCFLNLSQFPPATVSTPAFDGSQCVIYSGSLLRKKMVYYGWENGRFLIDGFPRNADNLDGWNKTMSVSVLYF